MWQNVYHLFYYTFISFMEYFDRTFSEIMLLFPGFLLGFLKPGYFSFVIWSAKKWRHGCFEPLFRWSGLSEMFMLCCWMWKWYKNCHLFTYWKPWTLLFSKVTFFLVLSMRLCHNWVWVPEFCHHIMMIRDLFFFLWISLSCCFENFCRTELRASII